MLKILGLLMIIISGAGIGLAKSREFNDRLRAQEMLLQMVILLKGEIRYGNASLFDAMTGAGEKLPGVYGAFLKETAKEMEAHRGAHFGELFRKNAIQYFGELGLPKEEQERLFSLGEHLGFLDLAMQMKQLELYEKEVETSMEQCRRELPERRKVWRSLGILFGIFLCILVL